MQAHVVGAQSQAGKVISTGISSRSERVVAAAVAALLGIAVIWGVGFSHIPAVHNAAHDTRHSIAFPCH